MIIILIEILGNFFSLVLCEFHWVLLGYIKPGLKEPHAKEPAEVPVNLMKGMDAPLVRDGNLAVVIDYVEPTFFFFKWTFIIL